MTRTNIETDAQGSVPEFESVTDLVDIAGAMKASTVLIAGGYTVVLKEDNIVALRKGSRDARTQLLAARQRVGRVSHRAADSLGLGDDAGVGELAHYAECNQSRRVGMDDSA